MGTKHKDFNYRFSDTQGITFRAVFHYYHDLLIYYGNRDTKDYIDCRCSRWDVQNYDVIVETWLKKSDLITLRDNTVPGAVGELYTILGKPRYYDQTWQGNNTLYLKPNPAPEDMTMSNLENMKEDCYIYVQNITEHPITNTDWISVKIEGKLSGSSAI